MWAKASKLPQYETHLETDLASFKTQTLIQQKLNKT